MGYTPHVLVVGGGSTGTTVARDLAMRGLRVTLVDEGPLAGGTSGSTHGLLHCGARYADDDPATAAACLEENRRLRSVAGHLVTDTGGLVVSLPADDGASLETRREACEEVEIPVETLDGAAAREREPSLAADVEGALAVPDAVVDPARLCVATARSAVRHGADVRTGWRVVDVTVDDGAVDTVTLRNEDPSVAMLSADGSDELDPDYVVNAAGPWAGEVAGLAGLDLPIRHSQGAMLVTERAGLETVVTRCRPRAAGDVAVPSGEMSVLGTTDRDVSGPDAVERTTGDVALLVDELGQIVPDVADAQPYRARWGVRALPADDADVALDGTQTAALVDHESRDDVWGISTVYGGALPLHRRVAEAVTDHVCGKFGIDRPCRTAAEPLPEGPAETGGGGPPGPNPTLCESTGVSRRAVRAVLEDDELPPGADLRPVVQRTRAATGACQGGRCGHRLAAELSPAEDAAVVDRELRALLGDRWEGRRFACWGDGLLTAARTYAFHAADANLDGPPGPTGEPVKYDAFDAGRPDADRQAAGGDRDD